MSKISIETALGEFDSKAIIIGRVRTTYLEFGGSPEFNLELNKNVDKHGDVVCVGNVLHAFYGFTVKNHDDYVYQEYFNSIKDISKLSFTNKGALWNGEEPEKIAKNIYFLRTKHGGYVKMNVNSITTVPMGCSFIYEYSPTGIFK